MQRLHMLVAWLAACLLAAGCSSEDPTPTLDVVEDASGADSTASHDDTATDAAEPDSEVADGADVDATTDVDDTSSVDADAGADVWTCGSSAKLARAAAHDHQCIGNVGCNPVYPVAQPCECYCDQCDNERCVGEICDDSC